MDIKDAVFRTLVGIIPLISIIYIVVGIKLYRQKGPRHLNYFSILMFASAIYSFGYYLELNWIAEATFHLVRAFEFFGSVFIPSFGILFVRQLTGRHTSIGEKALLLALSFALWLLFITDPVYHQIYKDVEMLRVNGFTIAITTKNPLFYSLMLYYAYFVMTSSILLLRTYRTTVSSTLRSSFLFLLLSFQVAWVPVLIILLRLDTYFDPVPSTILIFCGLLMANEIDNDIFNLLIVRWRKDYENLDEPALLTDDDGKPVCCNAVAESLSNASGIALRNLKIAAELPLIDKTLNLFTHEGIQRQYVVHRNTFDNNNHYTTYLLFDITELNLMEDRLRQSERKYRSIFENTPLGVLHFDKNGIITDCNDHFVRIIGSSRKVLTGFDIHIIPDSQMNSALDKVLRGELSVYEGDYSSVTARKITPVRGIFAPIFSSDNKVTGGVGIFEDITERRTLEKALAVEKHLLETTLTSIGDGMISTDHSGNIVFLNKVAENLTGWTQSEAVGRPLTEVFQIIDEITNRKYRDIVQNVLKTDSILQIEQNARLIAKNGQEYPIENNASPIKLSNGETAGVVLVFRDCSERKQRLEAIEYLSYHDQLTGLYNRRYFDHAMSKLDEASQLPLTLMMIDVNGLKLINDSFGHAAGDDLLQKVAEILSQACKKRDVLARIGGDEFVIIMPNTDREAAERVLNSINSSLTQRKINSGVLSLSIGLGYKTDPSQDLDQVYKSAEDSMYRNKLYESTSMRNKTIGLITNVLFEKSQREMIHSRRVGKICENIALTLGFDSDAVSRIRIAGLMHDIGKIGIAESILNKPEALDPEESEEMKKHPEIGYRILLSVPEFSEVAESILAHHERWDGKGYPRGLKGDQIPLQARIITVADTFEAMTSDRTYRKAVSREEAITVLHEIAGTQLDPSITTAFIGLLQHPHTRNFN